MTPADNSPVRTETLKLQDNETDEAGGPFLHSGIRVWHAEVRDPALAVDEARCLVLVRRLGVTDSVRPFHPVAPVRSWAATLVFGEEGCVQSEVGSIPWEPSLGVDMSLDAGSQQDADGVSLPRAAKEGRVVLDVALQIRGAVKVAVLERKAGVLVLVGPSLGSVGVLLTLQCGLLSDNLAVLEYRVGISENEVDGAHDDAFAVELA